MKGLYLFSLMIVLCLSSAAFSQQPDAAAPQRTRREGARPKLMEALGLSQDQMKEIARLNQERRPKMQAAQQRLRESVRALDMAIYADSVSDSDYASRLEEHQAAQAEVARLRFDGELAMRKVLTPDQLVRFRQFRRQFNAVRERNQKERQMRRAQDRPAFGGPPRRPSRPLPQPEQ